MRIVIGVLHKHLSFFKQCVADVRDEDIQKCKRFQRVDIILKV
jgi:hypothetical protein